jgi:uncharacterized surface protein with fasciclin (FAS1) repeats
MQVTLFLVKTIRHSHTILLNNAMNFKRNILLVFVVLLGACAEDSFTDTGVEIFQGIKSETDLSTLNQAIERANLRDALVGTQYTLFAPTNQAFTDAGININAIDPDVLRSILQYHMIPTRLDADRLDITYGVRNGFITPTAAGTNPIAPTNWLGNLTYLGVQTLNLGVNANVYYTQAIEVLDNANGTLRLEGFYVNGAPIVEADAFEGGDGVVHKINKVLLPPSGSASVMISSDPELSLFDKLVKKASANANGIPSFSLNVLDVLPTNALAATRAGTLTVLAPTDDAMIAAGFTATAIDGLTVAQCFAIARQHVIGARWFSSDLKNQLFRLNPAVTAVTLPPLAGANVVYNNTGSNLFFSTATTPSSTIAVADVVTTNGVIHKINTVLQ